MGFNNEIQTSRPNVTEIVSKMRSGEYYVDRSFQRRLVWTDKQKVRLIETVLMEYPMPEIYLWERVPDPETGHQNFSIVDGQQRLSSLRQFINNEWPLKKTYLDQEHQAEDYADKFWKDLSQERKAQIYQYNVNARRIPSKIPEEQIRLIFARLNETDRSLNPQEMRNATLNGEFLIASVALADSDEMRSFDIFSTNDVRRMLDVEFASQLLGYERKGITNETAAALNDLYDTYSNEYPDAASDVKKVKKSLRLIKTVIEEPTVKEMFESQNNVYTLHVLFDIEPTRSEETWRDALITFVSEYKSAPPDDEDPENPPNKHIADFRKGASSRTRSMASRRNRIFGLRNWIREYLGEPIREKAAKN